MKAQDTNAYRNATNDLIGEHLRAGRTVRFMITTTSMLPLLAPGDVVLVQPMPAEAVQLGDILVRPIEEVWLAHRLVECQSNTVWITKGDNQLGSDHAFCPTHVEGVVIASERAGYVRHRRLPRTRCLNLMLAFYSRAYARARARSIRRAWRGLLVSTAIVMRWISQ